MALPEFFPLSEYSPLYFVMSRQKTLVGGFTVIFVQLTGCLWPNREPRGTAHFVTSELACKYDASPDLPIA